MIEKQQVKLGYVSLTDSLPLLVASECGFFESAGVSVALSNEPSWANIRDKVILGELDGAQMLAPMVLASTLGVSGIQKSMMTMFSLSLNGNGVTVSNDLWAELSELAKSAEPLEVGRALVALVESRERKLTLATVFPMSMHSYLLRYWLAASGLQRWDLVRIVVVPPVEMVSHLRMRHIDGFCVGEPWNSVAGVLGVGRPLLTGYEIWQNAPEKVFGVTQEWGRDYPGTHRAIVTALRDASVWIESNAGESRQILDKYLVRGVDAEALADARWGLDRTCRGAEHFHVFHHFAANFPWRSHAAWILAQMKRWGHVPVSTGEQVIDQVYRIDLHREVFCDQLLPSSDEKEEGLHKTVWNDLGPELGPDLFVDSRIQD